MPARHVYSLVKAHSMGWALILIALCCLNFASAQAFLYAWFAYSESGKYAKLLLSVAFNVSFAALGKLSAVVALRCDRHLAMIQGSRHGGHMMRDRAQFMGRILASSSLSLSLSSSHSLSPRFLSFRRERCTLIAPAAPLTPTRPRRARAQAWGPDCVLIFDGEHLGGLRLDCPTARDWKVRGQHGVPLEPFARPSERLGLLGTAASPRDS